MTTTPTTCSYCGAAFSEANPPQAQRIGVVCEDAWKCVERYRGKEEVEKQQGGKDNDDQ